MQTWIARKSVTLALPRSPEQSLPGQLAVSSSVRRDSSCLIITGKAFSKESSFTLQTSVKVQDYLKVRAWNGKAIPHKDKRLTSQLKSMICSQERSTGLTLIRSITLHGKRTELFS